MESTTDTGLDTKDGVNPFAPDVLPTLQEQIDVKQKELTIHRATMGKAKTAHEKKIGEAMRLRKLLLQAEAASVDNTYEAMVTQEHVILAQLQALETQITSHTTSGVAASAGGR